MSDGDGDEEVCRRARRGRGKRNDLRMPSGHLISHLRSLASISISHSTHYAGWQLCRSGISTPLLFASPISPCLAICHLPFSAYGFIFNLFFPFFFPTSSSSLCSSLALPATGNDTAQCLHIGSQKNLAFRQPRNGEASDAKQKKRNVWDGTDMASKHTKRKKRNRTGRKRRPGAWKVEDGDGLVVAVAEAPLLAAWR
jgi:hypothetical protein